MKTIIFLIISLLFTKAYAQVPDSLLSFEMDPVVVTGSRYQLQKSQVPITVSVLSPARLESSSETNVLPSIARDIPGVFLNQRSTAGFGIGSNSGGVISIRGISGNPNTRILMLIDGQPQYMGIFGHPISESYTRSDVERVEVIRGAGSLLYGSNALGGAINLITKKPKTGFGVSIEGQYGSFGSYRSMQGLSYSNETFYILGSSNQEGSEGFRSDGNDEFLSRTGYLKSGYTLNPQWSVSADGHITYAVYHFPGTVSSPVTTDRREYTRGRMAVSLDNQTTTLTGAFKAFYNYGYHRFSDGFRSNDENKGLTLYQTWIPSDNISITGGLDYKSYGGKPTNKFTPEGAPAGFDQTYSIEETDVYALVNYQLLSEVSVQAGARFNQHSIFESVIVPAAGVVYQASNTTTLKMSYNQGYRNPAVVELYLFPTSNPDLKPEFTTSIEAGVTQYWFDYKMSVVMNVFYLKGEDYIRDVVISSPPPKKINVDKVTHQGIDLEWLWLLSTDTRLSANYQYLDVSDAALYAPRHSGALSIQQALQGVKLSGTAQFISGLRISLPPQSKWQDYVLLSAGAEKELLNGLSVKLDIQNLLDQSYEVDAGYPMPGRVFWMGLKYQP